MADEQNKEQDVQKDGEMQKHEKGGGNRNAIAYGILQANGYNTRGMSPAEAWELLTALNLMDSERWKRTDEDKADIKARSDKWKEQGGTREKIEQNARKHTKYISFDGVKNLPALSDAVDTINGIMDKYKLSDLFFESVEDMGFHALASAGSDGINIGTKILRNPSAAYRICVADYQQTVADTIRLSHDILSDPTESEQNKQAAQKCLDAAKRGQVYKRHNVVYKGREVETVVAHEMGHVIAGQLHGFTSDTSGGKNRKLIECYEDAKRTGAIYNISEYAAYSPDEFFAECFAVYHMGVETLPPKINNVIKEMLKP